jgi:hypothetical protein
MRPLVDRLADAITGHEYDLGERDRALLAEVAAVVRERDTLREQLASAKADTERLEFWFGPATKLLDVNQYLLGVREGWNLNQWRHFLDAARAAGGKGGER